MLFAEDLQMGLAMSLSQQEEAECKSQLKKTIEVNLLVTLFSRTNLLEGH